MKKNLFLLVGLIMLSIPFTVDVSATEAPKNNQSTVQKSDDHTVWLQGLVALLLTGFGLGFREVLEFFKSQKDASLDTGIRDIESDIKDLKDYFEKYSMVADNNKADRETVTLYIKEINSKLDSLRAELKQDMAHQEALISTRQDIILKTLEDTKDADIVLTSKLNELEKSHARLSNIVSQIVSHITSKDPSVKLVGTRAGDDY